MLDLSSSGLTVCSELVDEYVANGELFFSMSVDGSDGLGLSGICDTVETG